MFFFQRNYRQTLRQSLNCVALEQEPIFLPFVNSAGTTLSGRLPCGGEAAELMGGMQLAPLQWACTTPKGGLA